MFTYFSKLFCKKIKPNRNETFNGIYTHRSKKFKIYCLAFKLRNKIIENAFFDGKYIVLSSREFRLVRKYDRIQFICGISLVNKDEPYFANKREDFFYSTYSRRNICYNDTPIRVDPRL